MSGYMYVYTCMYVYYVYNIYIYGCIYVCTERFDMPSNIVSHV